MAGIVGYLVLNIVFHLMDRRIQSASDGPKKCYTNGIFNYNRLCGLLWLVESSV